MWYFDNLHFIWLCWLILVKYRRCYWSGISNIALTYRFSASFCPLNGSWWVYQQHCWSHLLIVAFNQKSWSNSSIHSVRKLADSYSILQSAWCESFFCFGWIKSPKFIFGKCPKKSGQVLSTNPSLSFSKQAKVNLDFDSKMFQEGTKKVTFIQSKN